MGLISIAVMGVFALSTFNANLDRDLDRLEITQETREYIDSQRIKYLLIEIPENVDPETREAIRSSINNSFLTSYRLIMMISAALVLLGTAVAWLTIEKRKPG